MTRNESVEILDAIKTIVGLEILAEQLLGSSHVPDLAFRPGQIRPVAQRLVVLGAQDAVGGFHQLDIERIGLRVFLNVEIVQRQAVEGPQGLWMVRAQRFLRGFVGRCSCSAR